MIDCGSNCKRTCTKAKAKAKPYADAREQSENEHDDTNTKNDLKDTRNKWHVLPTSDSNMAEFDSSNHIHTRMKPNARAQSTHNEDDDSSFVAAKDCMSCIGSQSTLCGSLKIPIVNEPHSFLFGCDHISHMKRVMKDTHLSDNNMSLESTTDDNTEDSKVNKSTNTN